MAAKDGYLPKRFAKLHSTRKTPINSIVSGSRIMVANQLRLAIATTGRIDQRDDRFWRLFLPRSVLRLQRLAVLLPHSPWSPDIEESGAEST